MKLSNREKVLILILLIVVIVYVGYRFIPFNNLFVLDDLENEYNLKKTEYDTMSQNIILKSNYETKFEELSQAINDTKMIAKLEQEQVLVFLNTYLEKNNIDSNNVSFTESTVVPVTIKSSGTKERPKSSFETIMEEINDVPVTANTESSEQSEVTENNKQEDSSESQEAGKDTGLTVRSISTNIAFKSTYNDMIKFIDDIQNYPMDISITNINTVAGDGDLIQGNMTLNFYSIPKLESFIENNKDWIWTDLVPFGKSNPFSGDAVAQVIASAGSGFDFYMSLQPETSDLPTVLIGRANDSSRKTYVSEDNNAIENIDFYFKSENDKYYYRYSTKNGSYPQNGAWEEFTPVSSGNIYIKVYSSERSFNSDSSGANIGVTNTSGLRVRFEIENDDKSNSRVYFKDPKSVIVTRR